MVSAKTRLWILLGLVAFAHVLWFMSIEALFPQLGIFVRANPMIVGLASFLFIVFAFDKLGRGSV